MRVFGQHEPATIAQLTDVASRAERAALMADGHVGYVMPIGGVAAYRNRISVVGVGYDIACLVAGTPVVTRDGYHVPIETVEADVPATCWDGARTRPISPLVGAVERGVRETVRVRLANRREVVATPEHRLLTPDGWRAAGSLTRGDRVACQPFVGVPHEPYARRLELDVPARAADALRERALLPLRGDDPRFPTLVRLLGYVSGDGHLARDGKAVSVYTVHEEDAADAVADVARLGFRASTYRRSRGPRRRDELCVRASSTALHALLAALGTPVGRKRWTRDPMRWLFDAPDWVRAHFLSAFASAEMTTPRRHASGVVPNLQLKQAGEDDAAIRFVARLCESLGFAVSVAPSGPAYGAGRRAHVLQILGGATAQVAFAERVGFCYAAAKRRAAAEVASVVWAHGALVGVRAAARDEARALHAGGSHWRDVTRGVAARYGVTEGFAYHAIYDRRGDPRRTPGAAVTPDACGEVCWVPVGSVGGAGAAAVYDVITADPAECFFANGVVAHNCGNAAIRTDVSLGDLGPPEKAHRALAALADEIAGTVSFGMGRRNQSDDAPVDDPLFHDGAWSEVPVKERKTLKTKARQQLGTVGSGNHYVDVFADEGGTLWVGVHFGSRGFGHSVASGFMAMHAGRKWGERVPEREVLLDLDESLGAGYWALMNLAGRYAYAGREWVARKVVALLGAAEVELVHNHHNFGWTETHGGEELIVVRKGATPAFPGQTGFIGGSMGDDAVIVRGARPPEGTPDAEAQQEALFSTVHGAGRVMSRTMAAGKRNRRTGEVLRPGLVTPEMMHGWVREKGVILRGGGLDESPHAYRRLPSVLEAQGGTIEVVHTLRPLVVVMAGADEVDPYRD